MTPLCLLAACDGKTGPTMKIVVAQGAVGGRCNGPPSDATVPTSGISTLRMSVLRRTGSTRVFVCDRVFEVPKDQPHLKLPIDGVDTFDIIAEGFASAASTDPDNTVHGSFRRKASGILLGVDPKATMVKELDQLRMLPTEASSCAEDTLSVGRAFHTATKLPDGTVLLVGGTIASSTNPNAEDFSETLQLTGAIEIYDPKTGTFTNVTEATAGKPRAFHNAFLMNATPPYRILVVGGATIDDATQPAFGLSRNFHPGPRLIPVNMFTPLSTKVAGAEVLVYDPVAKSVSRESVSGFTPAMFQAGAPVPGGGTVSDGLDYAALPPTAVKQAAALQQGETSARTGTAIVPRFGATLTTMHDGTQLLWGGNYDMNNREPTGEYLTGGNGGTSILRSTASLTGETPTAFHTATLVSQDATFSTVLLTGGFVFTDVGGAMQAIDADGAVRVLTYTPGASAVSFPDVAYLGFAKDATCSVADRYRPAGWESAIPLPRERALISGGSPSQVMDATGCKNCPTGQSGFFCALKQMAIYDDTRGSISKFAELAVGRFGHTSTLLDDGSVLIVGGIGSSEAGPRVLRDSELVNLRTALPPIDLSMSAPVDLDDPIADELKAAGLERRPGKPATLPGQVDKPNKLCGLL